MRNTYILTLLAIMPVATSTGMLPFCHSTLVNTPHKVGQVRVSPEELHCLSVMVYGEARGETERGMVAVAYTAVNRAAKKTVCQVVLAPKQYSIFNNNPELKAAAMSAHLQPKQKNIIDKASWDKAIMVAHTVLLKSVADPTLGATHYIAPVLMGIKGYSYPKWSKEFTLVAVIDSHRFYKPKNVS